MATEIAEVGTLLAQDIGVRERAHQGSGRDPSAPTYSQRRPGSVKNLGLGSGPQRGCGNFYLIRRTASGPVSRAGKAVACHRWSSCM